MPPPEPAAAQSVDETPPPAGLASEPGHLPREQGREADLPGKRGGKQPFFYGGQAVIEGVMMRGKSHYAVAVRLPTINPDTLTREIVVDRGELKAPIYTHPIWKLPFVRGLGGHGGRLRARPVHRLAPVPGERGRAPERELPVCAGGRPHPGRPRPRLPGRDRASA